MQRYPITAMSAACGLGRTTDAVLDGLFAGRPGLVPFGADDGLPFDTFSARIPGTFDPLEGELAAHDTHQHRIALHLLAEVDDAVRAAVDRWGPDRVGVVVGTTTGGIADTEQRYPHWAQTGAFDGGYGLATHHVFHHTAAVLAHAVGARGPRWAQSSACSSSTKIFGSARRLLDLGVCDAVLVGGVDTWCRFTQLGFRSLGVLSSDRATPFAEGRTGINLGEGGGLLLIERDGDALGLLAGVGETSDAHHMTQPHPEGAGLAAAITRALASSGLAPDAVDLVSAHGTGTAYNDASEAAALATVLPHRPRVLANKGQTGHTLGACGALEAVFCLASMQRGVVPPSVTQTPLDPGLDVAVSTEAQPGPVRVALDLSAAFAGHNGCVVLEAP